MIILDNNISPRVAKALSSTYKGILHVVDVELSEKKDTEIRKYAYDNMLHIMTKDADFNNMVQLKGFPPKVIWLRTGNSTSKKIVTLLQAKEKEIKTFLRTPVLGTLEIR